MKPIGQEEPKKKIIKIGGRDVDFTVVAPFTGRDKKALKVLGIDFKKLDALEPEDEGKLLLYVVKKLDPATTQDEVDDLPLKLQQDILKHVAITSRDVDSPFSTPSTSSPSSMGGQKGS